jgi:hypothetical protein
LAGLPSIQRLHPLLPDTRKRKRCSFSSMHNPMVEARGVAPGSICHHLHVLHGPHDDDDDSLIGLFLT